MIRVIDLGNQDPERLVTLRHLTDFDFTNFLDDKNFSGSVKVVTQSETIDCSAALLAQHSRVLKDRLKEEDTLFLTDNNHVRECLTILYGGSVELNEENFADILKFMVVFDVPHARKQVLSYMFKKKWNLDNASFLINGSFAVVNTLGDMRKDGLTLNLMEEILGPCRSYFKDGIDTKSKVAIESLIPEIQEPTELLKLLLHHDFIPGYVPWIVRLVDKSSYKLLLDALCKPEFFSKMALLNLSEFGESFDKIEDIVIMTPMEYKQLYEKKFRIKEKITLIQTLRFMKESGFLFSCWKMLDSGEDIRVLKDAFLDISDQFCIMECILAWISANQSSCEKESVIRMLSEVAGRLYGHSRCISLSSYCSSTRNYCLQFEKNILVDLPNNDYGLTFTTSNTIGSIQGDCLVLNINGYFQRNRMFLERPKSRLVLIVKLYEDKTPEISVGYQEDLWEDRHDNDHDLGLRNRNFDEIYCNDGTVYMNAMEFSKLKHYVYVYTTIEDTDNEDAATRGICVAREHDSKNDRLSLYCNPKSAFETIKEKLAKIKNGDYAAVQGINFHLFFVSVNKEKASRKGLDEPGRNERSGDRTEPEIDRSLSKCTNLVSFEGFHLANLFKGKDELDSSTSCSGSETNGSDSDLEDFDLANLFKGEDGLDSSMSCSGSETNGSDSDQSECRQYTVRLNDFDYKEFLGDSELSGAVKVMTNSEVIVCNAVFLAKQSEVLRAIIKEDKELFLTDNRHARECLSILYGGSVNLTEENFRDIFKFMSVFDVFLAQEKITNFMVYYDWDLDNANVLINGSIAVTRVLWDKLEFKEEIIDYCRRFFEDRLTNMVSPDKTDPRYTSIDAAMEYLIPTIDEPKELLKLLLDQYLIPDYFSVIITLIDQSSYNIFLDSLEETAISNRMVFLTRTHFHRLFDKLENMENVTMEEYKRLYKHKLDIKEKMIVVKTLKFTKESGFLNSCWKILDDKGITVLLNAFTDKADQFCIIECILSWYSENQTRGRDVAMMAISKVSERFPITRFDNYKMRDVSLDHYWSYVRKHCLYAGLGSLETRRISLTSDFITVKSIVSFQGEDILLKICGYTQLIPPEIGNYDRIKTHLLFTVEICRDKIPEVTANDPGDINEEWINSRPFKTCGSIHEFGTYNLFVYATMGDSNWKQFDDDDGYDEDYDNRRFKGNDEDNDSIKRNVLLPLYSNSEAAYEVINEKVRRDGDTITIENIHFHILCLECGNWR